MAKPLERKNLTKHTLFNSIYDIINDIISVKFDIP